MEQLDSIRFAQKTVINNLSKDDLSPYQVTDSDQSSMNKGAVVLSDGVIVSSESIDMSVDYLATADQEKILPWKGEVNFADYVEFFRSLTEVPVNQ